MSILQQSGAGINTVDMDGWTALRYAIANEELPVVQQLLVTGAWPDMRDAEGQTAVTAANALESPDAAALISAEMERRRGMVAPALPSRQASAPAPVLVAAPSPDSPLKFEVGHQGWERHPARNVRQAPAASRNTSKIVPSLGRFIVEHVTVQFSMGHRKRLSKILNRIALPLI